MVVATPLVLAQTVSMTAQSSIRNLRSRSVGGLPGNSSSLFLGNGRALGLSERSDPDFLRSALRLGAAMRLTSASKSRKAGYGRALNYVAPAAASAPGRIWYCPDDEIMTVLLTRASCGHPKETD